MILNRAIGFFMILFASLNCGAPTSAQKGEQGRQSLKPSSEKERIVRFEQQIEELRETLKIPGLSAALVKDQTLVWSKGFGYADIENKIPATPDTNYRIASVTKTFASMLLMRLVEQGKLNLDDPMSKYSPGFQDRFKNDAVKIRHVFSHTSHDTPGEGYRYDGNRYSFLTEVIEKVSGKNFRDLLVNDILDKIEMQGSVPGQDILDDRAKWSTFLNAERAKRYEEGLAKLAKPYRIYGAEVVQSVYPSRRISASAGLVSNAVDLAKYDVAIDRHNFIKAETQERAWTPTVSTNGANLPYGLGWFIQSYQGMRLVWHYGYWPDSFSSLYLKIPEKNLTFILLANSDGLSAPFRLGGGNVAGSAFANSFLRIFAFEDALGRGLPDPHWSQPDDRFKTEIDQLAKQSGSYRYDAELISHNFLTRWLDGRRTAARQEVKLDPKVYDLYVGQYRIEPAESLSVTKEGDRIYVKLFGNAKFEAFAESENIFFLKAQDARLTFFRGNDGRVTHAEIELSGQKIRATKTNE